MNEYTKIWALGFIFFLWAAAVIVQHENRHAQVYTQDGCTDVHIQYNWLSASTSCLDDDYIMSAEAFTINGLEEIITDAIISVSVLLYIWLVVPDFLKK